MSKKMILKYKNFKDSNILNENVAGAKKILKDTYILNKAVTQVSKLSTDRSGMILLDSDKQPIIYNTLPDDLKNNAKLKIREIKLTEEEVRNIERNQIFTDIRNMLGDKLGYAQLFTYLAIKENHPMDELKEMLAQLNEYSDLLGKLRRPISNYIDPNINNNAEQLVDDLEELRRYRKLKKFIDEFTSDLKKDYQSAQPFFKNKLVDIAAAFDELGKDENTGKIDAEKQRYTQKRFFDKIRRYKNIRELISAAELFLSAESNADISKFYNAIEQCNKKYGNYGVSVLYDEGGLLIMEVKSFSSCKELFSNTSWCIANQMSYWNSYVGGDTVFTRQYSIMNFNLPPSDNKSIIGITVGAGKKITACHLKNDGNASSTFQSIFNEFEKSLGLKKGFIWEGLNPMSDADIEGKKRRIKANRDVIKSGISLNDIKKYILEDGADVNASQGMALHNAVIEADPSSKKYEESLEKIKWLLDHQASPNLRNESDNTIDKIKSFDVLKLLIQKGANMTRASFLSISDNMDAIKFAFENGVKPDFNNGLPLRDAIKKGRLDIVKALIENYNLPLTERSWKNIQVAAEHGRFDIMDYLISKNDFFKQKFDEVMEWVSTIDIKESSDKEKVIGLLQKIQKDYVDTGRVVMRDGPFKDKSKSISYDGVVKKYGNFANYLIKINDTLN